MRRLTRLFSLLTTGWLFVMLSPTSAVAAEKGYLQVNIANPGIQARVFVDGQPVGNATRLKPVNTMQGLPVGNVQVRVEADGFQPLVRQETIRSNQWTQAVYELKPAPAAPPPPPPPVFGNTDRADPPSPAFGDEPSSTPPSAYQPVEEDPNDPIQRCRDLLDAGRLAEPPSDNAADCYFAILETDPANAEALEALDQIEQGLLARVESAIRRGRKQEAMDNWEHLDRLSPEHPQLPDLDRQIMAMEEGEAAAPTSPEPGPTPTPVRQAPPALVLPAVSGPPRPPAMARIEAGCYNIGSPAWEAGRDPDEDQARVCVESFDMALHEVSIAEFHRFVQASAHRTDAEWNRERAQGCFSEGEDGGWTYVAGRDWRRPGFTQQLNHPVVCVSWVDAVKYVEWLNAETGQAFRLPTEAEWEYAARAGNANARYWGNAAELACQYANVADQRAAERYRGFEPHDCDDGHAQTAPVGSYRPNSYGLYDMLGNVAEWTCSYYGNRYAGSEKRCSRAESSALRVNRGGSWTSKPDWTRSATRVRLWPRGRADSLGFRLARDAAP